jgi:hypothetical protein
MKDISDDTFARLQAHAEPLVDTMDSVINRALDALEQIAGTKTGAGAPDRVGVLNPAAPPNLAHTTVKSIELCGRTLKPSETYWNTLFIAVLREGSAKGRSAGELKQLILGNCVTGRKEDEGYRYFKDLDLSIQGQDSNAAWRATYHLASKLGLPLRVTFAWQDNPKAAFPGASGSFVVGA